MNNSIFSRISRLWNRRSRLQQEQRAIDTLTAFIRDAEHDVLSVVTSLQAHVDLLHDEQERKNKIIETYVKDAMLPYVDVEVKNVALDDLRQSPYSARIEFEKVYTNPSDHTELKRERWIASVTYVFRDSIRGRGGKLHG